MNTTRSLWIALALPLALVSPPAWAETMSGTQILEEVDKNYVSDARTSKVRLIIHGRRGTREMVSQSWILGDNAFTEYIAPARERGTKMLKKGDRLWTYTPSSDRVIAIAGHLLRKSMSGSDLSYEDFMEDPILSKSYDAKVVGEKREGSYDVYVLDLTAKSGVDVAYHTRKLMVDKKTFIPIRQEMFAKSGKKLKTIVVEDIFSVDNRHYPKKLVVKDQLKGSGKGTEVIIEEIDFNVKIRSSRFSKGALWR